MVTEHIDLRSLNIDELTGVVNLYPWYGAARKELCMRIAKYGGKVWGEHDYATNALYVGSRRIISDIVRSSKTRDYSDKDIENLLKAYTSSGAESEKTGKEEMQKRRTRAVGGDFFSQDEYDSVKESNDNIFSAFASKAKGEEIREKSEETVLDSFCTETLAQIYTEQGYFEQAKFIYSKLSLRYPEKNAYFAGLIQKLGQLTDN